ncbi:hypothetical protein N0V93_003347 [Gnomoniopsis smithogilvyi]|uniref:Uncharacterized protein n=1 Tax=Gnomoniopsis smithogilvyi TaxID=1191159 RepID=A0A9W8Z0K3_9PEZI|nr:hypothetical protein N0V93_003347 [Gnomoniopsis smithogilvyi]
MQFSTTLLPSLLAVLGGSNLASAVCTGNQFAIGTPSANAASGISTYTIYNAGTCAVSQTAPVTNVCISQYFLCALGTTNIEEYDDPVTGLSYTCSADTTAEKCGSDTITFCCKYGEITG